MHLKGCSGLGWRRCCNPRWRRHLALPQSPAGSATPLSIAPAHIMNIAACCQMGAPFVSGERIFSPPLAAFAGCVCKSQRNQTQIVWRATSWSQGQSLAGLHTRPCRRDDTLLLLVPSLAWMPSLRLDSNLHGERCSQCWLLKAALLTTQVGAVGRGRAAQGCRRWRAGAALALQHPWIPPSPGQCAWHRLVRGTAASQSPTSTCGPGSVSASLLQVLQDCERRQGTGVSRGQHRPHCSGG